jgi:hypothetical protein
MNAAKLNRKEVSLAAESIRITLQKLARRLEDLMNDVGGEDGWPAAYETLSDVRSDVERCDDSLANRFPS